MGYEKLQLNCSVRHVQSGVATALYIAALILEASALAAESNGPFGALSVAVPIGFQLTVMLAAAGLAAISSHRGWVALRSSVSN